MSLSSTTGGGLSLNRGRDLVLLDGVVIPEILFPPTGGWDTTATVTYPLPLSMHGETNEFRFTSLSADGGPNFTSIAYKSEHASTGGGQWGSGGGLAQCPDKRAPIAQITIPAIENSNLITNKKFDVLVDEEVSFSSANSYVPGGTIAAYEWNFADGNKSVEPNPVHSFKDIGSYKVTLKVTDDTGNYLITFKEIEVVLSM